MRTPAVALLASLLAAPVVAEDCMKLYGPYVSERELLHQFAPRFFQWVGDPWKFDVFVPIDFDENGKPMKDWSTKGNWRRIEGKDFDSELRPVVYAGLAAATETEWYLVYYYYHAVDRGEFFTRNLGYFFGGQHENDMEGGYIVVDRRGGGGRGRPIHYASLYHDMFDDRQLKKGLEPGREVFVVSEGGKHGARLYSRDEALEAARPFETQIGSRDWFVLYAGGARGGPVESQVEGDRIHWKMWQSELQAASGRRYETRLLWPLFENMFAEGNHACKPGNFWTKPAGRREIVVTGGPSGKRTLPVKLDWCQALRGEMGDKAKFPWGQKQDVERFLDPIQNMNSRSKIPVGQRYIFNPYLHAVLTGSIPSWTETSCPAFPPSLYQ